MAALRDLAPSSQLGKGPRPRIRARKKILIALLLAATVFALAVVILVVRWPFRQAAIVSALEEAASGKVEIKTFRQTFFPYPGCVAEGVIYRLGSNAPPFAIFQKLTIQSNLFSLLAKHIRLIQADGLHIFVASAKGRFKGLKPGSARVDQIVIHDAILEIPRKQPGKQSLQFGIHELTLDIGSLSAAIHFSARLSNPEPPGEIAVAGQFGPWRGALTPLSGNYKFENSDLGVFEGIAGLLSSQGKFGGALQHIDVSGETDIPAFEVKSSHHEVPLNSQFTAYVNAVTGDTFLNQVTSHFLQTVVISKGSIAAVRGQIGKTASIDLVARNGRIEDILRLFVKSPKAPMSGEISFKGRAILPPGQIRFLKKIEMQGDFGITDSSFTKAATQQKVDQLSQSSQKGELVEKGKQKKPGKDEDAAGPAPQVLSDLKGHVVLKSGIATLSNLSFYIPGAHAHMHGTYDMITQKIDLHGMLKMDSELSQSAHGAKAVLLKALEPFFKRKKHSGSEVPVKITGDYQHPSFGVDVAAAEKHVVK